MPMINLATHYYKDGQHHCEADCTDDHTGTAWHHSYSGRAWTPVSCAEPNCKANA